MCLTGSGTMSGRFPRNAPAVNRVPKLHVSQSRDLNRFLVTDPAIRIFPEPCCDQVLDSRPVLNQTGPPPLDVRFILKARSFVTIPTLCADVQLCVGTAAHYLVAQSAPRPDLPPTDFDLIHIAPRQHQGLADRLRRDESLLDEPVQLPNAAAGFGRDTITDKTRTSRILRRNDSSSKLPQFLQDLPDPLSGDLKLVADLLEREALRRQFQDATVSLTLPLLRQATPINPAVFSQTDTLSRLTFRVARSHRKPPCFDVPQARSEPVLTH